MSDFHLIKSEVKPLTKELAEEFRNLEPSPTEREIQPARLRYLEKEALEGNLIAFHWATAEFEGRTVRMNGQHSSNMLCNLNGEFPKGLFVHRDYYKVDGATAWLTCSDASTTASRAVPPTTLRAPTRV